ncbi:MAG TPA: isochorismatase family cysteine hydrolase [Gemmatimonadaceae bacterium]|jgi:nicotinamidase-related amidase|nr:isochorismatase family cysteine hydrolase [Gemmatimonadaceae bacterium]
MQALLVVDVQNEFSPEGLRAVPNHASAMRAIQAHIDRARDDERPIAWIQHHNKPSESRAFIPGTWGAALSTGMGPQLGHGPERLFQKEVFGAFTTTALDAWLRELGVTEVLIVGFYAHMCVSTSAREALVRGYDVMIDPNATGARDLEHPLLGSQSAFDVRRSAMLQLVHMGASVFTADEASETVHVVTGAVQGAAR